MGRRIRENMSARSPDVAPASSFNPVARLLVRSFIDMLGYVPADFPKLCALVVWAARRGWGQAGYGFSVPSPGRSACPARHADPLGRLSVIAVTQAAFEQSVPAHHAAGS